MNRSLPKLNFMARLRPREKMAVGMGLAAALLFGLFDFVLFPAYDTVKQYPELLVRRGGLLRKYKEVLAQEGMRRQSLEATQKQIAEQESHLLAARTTAAAQAQLQSLVNDLAKQSQLQINRSDFPPKKELSKDYESVSVRLDAVGTINQITGFLMAAKSLPTYILTDDVRILNYSGLNDSFKKNKQIAATLVVSGVMRHE